MLLADLRADIRYGLFNVAAHGPFSAAATYFMDVITNDSFTLGGVHDFRVKLYAKKFTFTVFDGRMRGVFCDGNGFKAFRKLRNLIAVRIPHLKALGKFPEQGAAAVFYGKGAFAVFAFKAAFNLASQKLGHHLEPETNSQYRDIQF